MKDNYMVDLVLDLYSESGVKIGKLCRRLESQLAFELYMFDLERDGVRFKLVSKTHIPTQVLN